MFTAHRDHQLISYGNRRLSVLQTQLRLGHGLLQQQCFNVGLTNDPLCTCRCPKVTEMHYILQCPLYSVAWRKLLLKINNIVQECFVLTSVFNQNSYRLLCRPPVGWGSTYCFTAVGVLVGVTPITKGPPAQIFFGWHVFCSPGQ